MWEAEEGGKTKTQKLAHSLKEEIFVNGRDGLLGDIKSVSNAITWSEDKNLSIINNIEPNNKWITYMERLDASGELSQMLKVQAYHNVAQRLGYDGKEAPNDSLRLNLRQSISEEYGNLTDQLLSRTSAVFDESPSFWQFWKSRRGSALMLDLSSLKENPSTAHQWEKIARTAETNANTTGYYQKYAQHLAPETNEAIESGSNVQFFTKGKGYKRQFFIRYDAAGEDRTEPILLKNGKQLIIPLDEFNKYEGDFLQYVTK